MRASMSKQELYDDDRGQPLKFPARFWVCESYI